MLKLIEVHSVPDAEGVSQLMASLDVTDNTEAERAEVLSNTRDLYGPECAYFWHDCGHDEGKACPPLVEAA